MRKSHRKRRKDFGEGMCRNCINDQRVLCAYEIGPGSDYDDGDSINVLSHFGSARVPKI
jgi:hypothetical protein